MAIMKFYEAKHENQGEQKKRKRSQLRPNMME